MNRADLQVLADCRLDEATTLFGAGKYAGAYYLGGYAVECALKACVAKLVKEFDFPDKRLAERSWTHNLDSLVKLAGLADELATVLQANAEFSTNWLRVKDWDEKARYESRDAVASQDLINAISDPTNGVLPWIKQYW
jgi:HEPN domain-containing protein